MSRFLLPIVFLALVVVSRSAHAQASERAQIARMEKILDLLEPNIERVDLGRLYVLKQEPPKVDALIVQRGLGHMATIREYQMLIVTFRYSSAFLEKIITDDNRDLIAELLRITDDIARDRGFDDSPYTQLIASTFTQMHELITQLAALPINDALKVSLQALIPDLGQTIATARQGDRPRAFEQGTLVYRKLVGLYPAFATVSASDAAFNLVIGIQGLNEFFAEYAQISDDH